MPPNKISASTRGHCTTFDSRGAYIAVASVAAYGRSLGQNLQPRSGLQKSGMLLAFRLSFGLAAKADDLAVRYLVQPLFIACELRG